MNKFLYPVGNVRYFIGDIFKNLKFKHQVSDIYDLMNKIIKEGNGGISTTELETQLTKNQENITKNNSPNQNKINPLINKITKKNVCKAQSR